MKLVVATVAVVTTALAASVGTAIGRNAPRSTAVHSLDRPVATSKPSPRPKARTLVNRPSLVSHDRRSRHLDRGPQLRHRDVLPGLS